MPKRIDLELGDTQKILDVCQDMRVLRNQAAYILATAYWETNRTVKPVEEAYWLSDTWRKNNLRYYPWHGRGYVQLTWEANYKKAAKKLGVPGLATKPELALGSETSAKILVKGCMEGWFTGRAVPHYITLAKSDFVGARRVVNGTDRAAKIADLAEQYDDALRKVGYGERVRSTVIAPSNMPKPTADFWRWLTSRFAGFSK